MSLISSHLISKTIEIETLTMNDHMMGRMSVMIARMAPQRNERWRNKRNTFFAIQLVGHWFSGVSILKMLNGQKLIRKMNGVLVKCDIFIWSKVSFLSCRFLFELEADVHVVLAFVSLNIVLRTLNLSPIDLTNLIC